MRPNPRLAKALGQIRAKMCVPFLPPVAQQQPYFTALPIQLPRDSHSWKRSAAEARTAHRRISSYTAGGQVSAISRTLHSEARVLKTCGLWASSPRGRRAGRTGLSSSGTTTGAAAASWTARSSGGPVRVRPRGGAGAAFVFSTP
jgi:hypothetical protein